MKKITLNFKGLLKKNYDGKLTFLFIDDFTKDFLNNHCKWLGNKPFNDFEFYVKYDPFKARCFLNKSEHDIISIEHFIDARVQMEVDVNHYSFTSNGKKITGWTINLRVLKPI